MVIQKILNEKIIDRNFYLDKIKKYLNTPLIKVLIWQRRVGKSTILKSIIQKLVWNKKIKKQNIFYINKELPLKVAADYGRQCTKLCKDLGLDTGNVPDPRFGRVKTYPLNVLEEIIGE
jgi:AAA+ ATPase superfamily predicted ATPase